MGICRKATIGCKGDTELLSLGGQPFPVTKSLCEWELQILVGSQLSPATKTYADYLNALLYCSCQPNVMLSHSKYISPSWLPNVLFTRLIVLLLYTPIALGMYSFRNSHHFYYLFNYTKLPEGRTIVALFIASPIPNIVPKIAHHIYQSFFC